MTKIISSINQRESTGRYLTFDDLEVKDIFRFKKDEAFVPEIAATNGSLFMKTGAEDCKRITNPDGSLVDSSNTKLFQAGASNRSVLVTKVKELLLSAVSWQDYRQVSYYEVWRDDMSVCRIEEDGTTVWLNKDGSLHRDNDLPAKIFANGDQEWYQNGRQHRDGDLPAGIDVDGCKYWYKSSRLHREGDQPALIDENGAQYWYENDRLHRDNDLPAVIEADGTQEWWLNGERVR